MTTVDERPTRVRPIKPPPFYIQALEGRALLERASLPYVWPALVQAPPGDGHRVLVMPGFNKDDRATRSLRRYLCALGYEAHAWGLGRNHGPTARVIDGMAEIVSALAPSGTTISLVGWSLGGVYARELAREVPTSIRYVATLGSPFRMRTGDASTLSGLLEARFKKNFTAAEPPREEDRPPLAMPSSAIYSRTDGFVRPHLCIDEATDQHENVEIRGSHLGLVANPSVYYVLADRLRHVSDGQTWQPFVPPPVARLLYPSPATWDVVRRRPPLLAV